MRFGDAKDSIAREVLRRFDAAGIELASAAHEIVHLPTLHVRHEPGGEAKPSPSPAGATRSQQS
jgi:hypothetical protein